MLPLSVPSAQNLNLCSKLLQTNTKDEKTVFDKLECDMLRFKSHSILHNEDVIYKKLKPEHSYHSSCALRAERSCKNNTCLFFQITINRMLTHVACTLMVIVVVVRGMPTGAPRSACNSLTPVGHNITNDLTNITSAITAQNAGADEVVSNYTVTISADSVEQGGTITGRIRNVIK